MQWGGRVSYSLYMTHFVVYIVVKKVLAWSRFDNAALDVRIGVLLAYLAASLLVAALTYYLVEEPGRRLVRWVSDRSRGPLPVTA